MVKVKLIDGQWKELEKGSKEEGSVYLDGFLWKNLQIIKEHIKKDWDFILLIDGREGAGKSVLAQTVGHILDPKLNLDNIVFSPDQFISKVKGMNEKYRCIIYDEAYGGLCSLSALQAKNKAIRQMLTEVRMKNLYLIIVLPSFFDLVKYVAIWRSACLLHVRVEQLNRGYFSFYNYDKKKYLYVVGKKFYNYGKPSPNFYGRFTNHYAVDVEEYKEKKLKVVEKIEQDEDKQDKYKRDEIICRLYNPPYNWSQQKIAELIGLTQQTIGYIIQNHHLK